MPFKGIEYDLIDFFQSERTVTTAVLAGSAKVPLPEKSQDGANRFHKQTKNELWIELTATDKRDRVLMFSVVEI